jgi:hypothetical protein
MQTADFAFVQEADLGPLGLPRPGGLRLLTRCKRAFTTAVLSVHRRDAAGRAAAPTLLTGLPPPQPARGT